MMQRTIRWCLLALALMAAPYAQAGAIYQVGIDTSGVANSDVSMFLTLNGAGTFDPLIAMVSQFSGADSFAFDADNSYGVTGTYLLDNSIGSGLFLNALNVGPMLRFMVSFAGDAIDNPTGAPDSTTFALWLFQPSGNPLPGFSATDPSFVLEIGGGTVRPAPEYIQDPKVTYDAAVPEPGTATLLVLGGAGLLFRKRRAA